MAIANRAKRGRQLERPQAEVYAAGVNTATLARLRERAEALIAQSRRRINELKTCVKESEQLLLEAPPPGGRKRDKSEAG